MSFKFKYLWPLVLLSQNLYAAPIDWKGTFAFDTQIIKDVRRTSENCTTANGSQCINPEESNARFQSMILKLNPNLIINDAVTIKGELTTGNDGRGGNLGSSTSIPEERNSGGGSYYTQNTQSTLNVNQIYAEIYADTALYKIGRFSKNWGLGAVVNGGNDTWDRFYSGYEGIEAQLKLGSFYLTPMWAKLHTSNEAANGRYDAYEVSLAGLYDNSNRNLKVGVYYSQKEVQTNNTLYDGATDSGSQNVTLIDVFVQKEWNNFTLSLEIPMLSGEVNNLYNTQDASFDSNAYILETTYQANSKWELGLNAGMVKGDDGESDSFEGMYLHPNYKKSMIMFRYNYNAFMDNTNQSDIFNASIVNTTYAQFFANYTSGEWTWKMSVLWAKANEVASSGSDFYDHDKQAVVTALADQSDDLGYELNLSFDYQWNPNIIFSGLIGYHLVGDYYSFANDPNNDLDTANVMLTGMQLGIKF